MTKLFGKFLFLVVGAALACVQTAHAELLSVLINSGGSITDGDKLFNDFTYLATGDMPAASAINVVPYTDPVTGDFGLKFQGAFTTAPGTASDALVGFKVTSTDRKMLIHDISLTGNPNVIDGNAGAISVTETALPENPNVSLSIFALKPGTTQLTDHTDFTHLYRSLHLQKDILAFSPLGGGLPTLSFFTQTFSQRAIPEPSTMLLMGLGLGTLMIGVARRKKTA